MSHIAIHLPVHKRPQVTEIAYRALERTRAEFHELGFTTAVHVGGTTQRDMELALKFGHTFHTLPNNPIGRKFQMLAERIHKEEDYEWFMEYGSDNVLAVGYAQKCKEMMDKGHRAFGVTDFYIANFQNTAIQLFEGGFSNIGRFTHRMNMETTKRYRGEWFSWMKNRCIDKSFYQIHKRSNGRHEPIPLEHPYLLDIKTAVNINPLHDYVKRKRVSLKGEFPEFTEAHPTWQPQAKSDPTASESTSAPRAERSQPIKPEAPSETTPTKTTRGSSSRAPRAEPSKARSKSSTRRRKTTTGKGKSSPAD